MASSSLLQNQRGIALLYLVIFFTLLGVLISVGARQFSSSVTLGKVNDTKAELERDVKMITAWAVKNGRLPTAIADVFGTAPPPDAWGKPVVYVYDSNLTATISGGLCGRSAITGQEVAFLLISGGDDMTVNSSAASIASGVQSGLVIEKDIYRSVPLMELLSQAGCAGATQGRLKILNNELPNACRGKTYSATIFSDGGVPPISFTYSGQPAWLIPTRTRFETLSSANAISPPTSQTVVVTATDTAANSVNRSYTFNIYSCAASP